MREKSKGIESPAFKRFVKKGVRAKHKSKKKEGN